MPVLAQNLRNAVLQAAMEGKLTKRIADDTLVLDSLDKIKQDRNNRISKKEIKKDKRLFDKVITVERFDIPDSWKWIRLGAVLYKLTDGTHKTPKYTTSGIKFVSVKDMSSGFLNLSNTKYISEKEHSELFSRCNPQKDDILLSKVGTTGVPAIVDTDEEFSLFVSVALLKFNDSLINKEYLYRVLQSPDVQQQAAENTKGIGNKNWVLDKIANTEIPLSPIEEQKRIVDKLNQIMPLIDEYEKLEEQFVELKKKFPEDMKDAILRAAMEGKLTEQLERDSSVDELLKSIKQEKEQLIKEKKIKKEKPLAPITKEEIAFDIPDSWRWERLGNIGNWRAGATPLKSNNKYYLNGTIPWLVTGDLNDSYINEVPNYITKLALESTSVKLIPKGSILIAMYGATIGKLGIINIDLTTNQACCACTTYGHFLNKYLFYFLLSYRKKFIEQGEGGAQPNISKEKIVKTLIPIPPIEEQQRIVDKLDQLLPLCDELKEV